MKKIYFLITILISNFCLAEWEVISYTEDDGLKLTVFFIDTENIVRNGNKVRFWEKINNIPNAKFASVRTFNEMDCKNKTYQTLQVTTFSELNLKGNIIQNYNPSPKTNYIAPGTVDDGVFKYVCK